MARQCQGVAKVEHDMINEQAWEMRVTAPAVSRAEAALSLSPQSRVTLAYHAISAGEWELATSSLVEAFGRAIVDDMPLVEARANLVRARLYRRGENSGLEELALQRALSAHASPRCVLTPGDLAEIFADLARESRRRGDSDNAVRYLVSGFKVAREPWQQSLLRTEYTSLLIRHRQYEAALARYSDTDDDMMANPAMRIASLANVCLCYLALRRESEALAAAEEILASNWVALRADDNSMLAIAMIAIVRGQPNDLTLLDRAVAGARQVADNVASRRCTLYARAAEGIRHYAHQRYSACVLALSEVLEGGEPHLSTAFMSLLFEFIADAHRDQGSPYLAQSWRSRGQRFDFTRIQRDGFTELLLLQTPQTPPLSPRQLAIIRLRAAGHNNADIAQTLGIHDGTLKADLRRVATMLGLRSPREVVAAAREAGLL
jgi:DNA-binding NarL/FixJ family response regulator